MEKRAFKLKSEWWLKGAHVRQSRRETSKIFIMLMIVIIRISIIIMMIIIIVMMYITKLFGKTTVLTIHE